ncbi:hypothetical protein F4679DRAFT_600396 [Xylaria curta]|nr:hypothetical protein F4679DRAFT_600396 [Xylaria curta]
MSITRSSENAEHPWDSIHQWQADAIEDSTENQFPLAAQRYNLIIRLYKLVLKLLCPEKDHDINQRRLKRAFETLILWGQQYGVSVGELDMLIDQSWRLRRSVLRTLTSIGRTLTDRLTPRIQQPLPEQLQKTSTLLRKAREEVIFLLSDNVESEHVDERSDDDDSDTSSVFEIDSFSEIAEDLTSDVGNLMDLDALYDAAKENANFYEEPVARTVADLVSTPGSAARVYTEMIQMRFPEANYELLDYLGRANYYRFVRGSQQRENNERQAEDNPETRERDAITVDESRFYDSGIGTSCYTGSYAETVMSFYHENGSVIRMPPLPEEGKKGLPFPCIACGNKVIVRSNRAWKRHLFSDLEPYNCLEISCRHIMSPFGRRENWVEHLAVHHGYGDQWQSFRCNLCLEETGQGEANVTIHLEKHLQDIALAALPNNVDEESKPESDFDSFLSNSTSPSEDETQNTPKDATSQAQHTWRLPNGHDQSDLPNSDSNARDPLLSTNCKISNKGHEGCLTCRKRKKKCDELKPQCTHCFRGGFICHQPIPPRMNKPSSYWSISEAADFPNLLRSYGSDWIAIAAHMRTKTAVMVKNYYTRRKESTDWEKIVQERDHGRGAEAFKAAQKKAEEEERLFEPTLLAPVADAESGIQHPPKGAISADILTADEVQLSDHGMKLSKAKKLQREALARMAAEEAEESARKMAEAARVFMNHEASPSVADSSRSRPQEGLEKQTSESIRASVSSPHNTPHYSPLLQPLQVKYQLEPSYPDVTPMRLQPPNSSSHSSSPQPQHADGGPFNRDIKNRAQGIEDFSKAEHESDHRRAQKGEGPDSPLLFPLDSDPEDTDEHLQSRHDDTVSGVVPNLERTMLDIYNNELYNPDANI